MKRYKLAFLVVALATLSSLGGFLEFLCRASW